MTDPSAIPIKRVTRDELDKEFAEDLATGLIIRLLHPDGTVERIDPADVFPEAKP